MSSNQLDPRVRKNFTKEALCDPWPAFEVSAAARRGRRYFGLPAVLKLSVQRASVIGAVLWAAALIVVGSPAYASGPAAVPHDIRDPNGFTHTFSSENWLHPPIAYFSGRDPDPVASGDIFVNASHSIQSGPMILNPQGQLLWFDPLPNRGAAYDVNVQSYQGQSVLTFYGGGIDMMLGHNYQTVGEVQAGNGYALGIHDFQLTPQGTALITVNKHVPWNLSSVGGSKQGMLVDNAVQEIDVSTGQVLWQWDSDQHVGLGASYARKPGKAPYDYFHLNSVQQLPDGNLLISARNTWAVYEIDKRTGAVLWTLGGKHSSFRMGAGTGFAWQHDARMHNDGSITLFDDGAGLYQSEPQSRGLHLRLNYKRHRVTLMHAWKNDPPLLTYSQGNVQLLTDGNTLVDFGSVPYFTEFDSAGKQLFSIHFSRPLQTYRAYRHPWWGEPTTPPAIATATTPHGTLVYASWNGATDVSSWRVLAGTTQDPSAMTPLGQFPKKDFETSISVASKAPYFAVEALNTNGQLRGTSAAAAR
jgi:Arylsulfotransferase (ASST)